MENMITLTQRTAGWRSGLVIEQCLSTEGDIPDPCGTGWLLAHDIIDHKDSRPHMNFIDELEALGAFIYRYKCEGLGATGRSITEAIEFSAGNIRGVVSSVSRDREVQSICEKAMSLPKAGRRGFFLNCVEASMKGSLTDRMLWASAERLMWDGFVRAEKQWRNRDVIKAFEVVEEALRVPCRKASPGERYLLTYSDSDARVELLKG